jgi:tetraacyldisaccharide 4'-kinase
LTFYRFFEGMIFHTKWRHLPFVVMALPFSLIYCFVCVARKLISTPKNFGIPIISVGNLTVGGSGKTPFTIALARRYDKPAIVLRGYGRRSSGLVVVSNGEKALVGVDVSGDEAMEYATSLRDAIVIVSEDRALGIQKAKDLGAKIVLLDDGFGKFGIAKFDILLEPKTRPINPFCIPAGPYRCPMFMSSFADLVMQDGRDFFRKVEVVDKTERMLLVTAISNPTRLDAYLPEGVVDKLCFKDHEYFDFDLIVNYAKRAKVDSILVTNKDAVKLVGIDFPVSKMLLSIEFTAVIESLDKIK